MQIEKNSRQIPKVQQICADKKYFDIMYAYLQQISEPSDDIKKPRILKKSQINFSALGRKLGISRQTASTKFKNLIKLGFVKEVNVQTYELTILENDIATLVPYDTLKLLVDALSENAISTYVYLFNRYFANNCKSFQFTLTQIKTFLGLCATTRSNDEVITNILFVLKKIGLIDFELTTVKNENDSFSNVKTVYVLKWLNNKC